MAKQTTRKKMRSDTQYPTANQTRGLTDLQRRINKTTGVENNYNINRNSAFGSALAFAEQELRDAPAVDMSVALYDRIKVMSKITDEVLVGFSGGKDSVVTMDLCFKYFKRVVPFFMYICPDLEFQERLLRYYESRYNTEIIRLPHMEVSEFFKYGTFRASDYNVPIISINEIYTYLRETTGIWWIAAGERINDSIVRRAMIKNSGSIDMPRGRFYPIAEWNKAEVMQYIKFAKLKLGEDSKQLNFSFKSLEGRELYFVKKYFPQDFERILGLYPYAEAAVLRYEKYGR